MDPGGASAPSMLTTNAPTVGRHHTMARNALNPAKPLVQPVESARRLDTLVKCARGLPRLPPRPPSPARFPLSPATLGLALQARQPPSTSLASLLSLRQPALMSFRTLSNRTQCFALPQRTGGTPQVTPSFQYNSMNICLTSRAGKAATPGNALMAAVLRGRATQH